MLHDAPEFLGKHYGKCMQARGFDSDCRACTEPSYDVECSRFVARLSFGGEFEGVRHPACLEFDLIESEFELTVRWFNMHALRAL